MSELDQKKCDVCGKSIPVWAPAGNCPACLMETALGVRKAVKTETPAKEKVGDWELHERIGEGAFGVVFAAEQTQPVRRSAAVKILRPGMASKEVLARFEAESQALALMNHPDIVTIYDAGTTDDGRPFFAMELVPGDPATRFAAGLPISEKLELFDRICAVVEHAHQRGIIHRDLKPANILVFRDDEGKAVVKLLDFGIAKATDHVLTDATILTAESQFMGTPEYMSPEQTAEKEIDIRADIYSLGVILFELLVGHPPFVLASTSLEAVLLFLKRVREETAPIPSSAASVEIPNDLDWIVSKAIEKERDRRYRSVGELRNDLRRFCKNEPVEARPPDTFYIVQKFLRRNWKLTAALSAIVLSITGAAIVSSIMALKAREASRQTRAAYSNSDLRTAISSLDRGEISHGIAHLVHSLRTDPQNQEAAMLLRSTLSQYPIPEQNLQAGLSKYILRAAFFSSPEGNSVVVTEVGEIIQFDPEGNQTGEPILFGGTNQLVRISSDKKLIVVTNIQGGIAVVDLENHRRIDLQDSTKESGHYVLAVEFSPDTAHLCVALQDGSVHTWDPLIGKKRWTVKLDSIPLSMVFFDSGNRIAIACKNGERIDLDSHTGEKKTEIPQQPEPVRSLVPSGTGFRYYTVSKSGIIAAVDKGRPPRTFTSERVDMPLLLSASDPKRRLTAYASEREVMVMTVDALTIIKRFRVPDEPTHILVHPGENQVFIGTTESGIHFWDFEKNQLLSPQLSRSKSVEAIQIDTDSRQLRCITRDAILQQYQLPDRTEDAGKLQYLPDQWAAVQLDSRNDFFVRARHLDLRKIPEIPKMPIRACGATSDGEIVFGAYRDGWIRLWEVKTGKLLAKIETATATVRCVDISSDGTLLIYRDKFRFVGIFDLTNKSKRQIDVLHRRDVSSVTFSPTGDSFATASDDGTARIWDLKSGEPITDPLRHDARGETPSHFCRYSPDGKSLITWGESDRTFRLWDTASGDPIGIPIITRGIPRFAQFLSGGDFLATVTEREDKTLFYRVWSLQSSLPITPEKIVNIDHFDFSKIDLPAFDPFPPEELNRIESTIGLKIGTNGIIEIPNAE